MPKEIQLSAKTLFKIAEALFLAYTQEQAAYLGGISERTLARLLKTDVWQQILRDSLEMEKPYRRKIYRGEPGWQGAAWMLERKYPGQLSKPEVQLSLNTGASVTNNTLVITAEQAQGLKIRNANLDEQLSKLSPPGSKTGPIIPIMSPEHLEGEVRETSQDPNNNELANKTLSSSVVLAAEGAAPTGTPDVGAGEVEPNLLPKLQPSKHSSNYRPGIDPPLPKKPGVKKKEKVGKNIENFNPFGLSSNNKEIKEISLVPSERVLKRGRGRPKKNG